MISIEKIERGAVRFIDTDLVPSLPQTGIKRIAIATGAAILVKRLGVALMDLKDNAMLRSLKLVDESGAFDLELIKQELINHLPSEGMQVDIPMVASVTFRANDIDRLYHYILEA